MTAATTPVVASSGAEQSRGGPPARFRTDIQGLRAVAVLLVIAWHAGVPVVSGGYIGVDVFFVISGYLITGLIVREIGSTGRLSLSRFYARRVRRLLPATALTFVGVAVMTIVVLPVTRWANIAGDMVASTLYVVNWRLADRSVEYLAEGSAASPLQHFWSLAVEEQFYVVWPLLIVVLAWWARRGRHAEGLSSRRMMIGLLAIGVPSLVWSIHLTVASPGPAYFVTTTRLWELGLGALLAVGASRAAQVPFAVRAIAGWLGLAAIFYAALTFTTETQFPGAAALVPTLGALAVLFAGSGDMRARVRLLDPAPMQDIGALSYSLYLWHWPVLVAATAVWGREDGTLWLPTALIAVGFSAVPAWFTYRVVEKPIHKSRWIGARPWRGGLVALLCVAVGIGSAYGIRAATPATPGPASEQQEAAPGSGEQTTVFLGAAALGDDPGSLPNRAPVDRVEQFVPDPISAADDRPEISGRSCIGSQTSSELTRCTFGASDSATVIAVAGDSKMHQWLTALESIASHRDWRIETFLMSACPLVDAPVRIESKPYSHCNEANPKRLAAIVEDPEIDLVLVSQVATIAYTPQGDKKAGARIMREGLLRVWEALEAAGKEVVVVADNQSPRVQMMECVAENTEELATCAFPSRNDATPVLLQAANKAEVAVVDMRPWICPGAWCPAVIGNVLVYRQGSHLTATYIESMAPYLERELVATGLL